ncbi:Hypothetical protein, putative [Bodo saltans]|uniref:Uncharacterized protein n=1 Tax=Bodo saltans TaxID=75058 RepID=A0A0S4J3N4_BODSA|nr:Hypothetical protein, putative [Bodo saltans]|eukprot:CUG86037.1 Hypothetical protein, putative [Bodo saltans]
MTDRTLFPTTFRSKRTAAAPSRVSPTQTISQMLLQLSCWTPPAHFVLTPTTNGEIVPEVVIGIGTITNNHRFFYFEWLYNEFLARGGDDCNVLKYFIKALAFRRCRSVQLSSLTSIFNKLFRHPLLDLEDWEDIASIVSDMNSKALVDELIIHSKMATRQHRPCFYSHLMRFATEQMSAPCFTLVMSIVNAINTTGATWTEATMYHLLGAFCRIKDHMPYATILHLVTAWRDARLREDDADISASPFSVTLMSRILSLTERALGPDLPLAVKIMDLMGSRGEWNQCISIVEASYEYIPPPPNEPWWFYVIDAVSVDVQKLATEPPSPFCIYVVPFSTLRAICESAAFHPDTHNVFTTKLYPLRELFQRFPTQIVVGPPEIELAMRVGGFDKHELIPDAVAGHICPRCVLSSAPRTVFGAAFSVVGVETHECGLPSVLPADNGASQIVHFARCGMGLHSQIGRTLRVVTTNKFIVSELTPLTLRFASSWFDICDRITAY